MTMGEKIQLLRKQHGMSQEELAQQLNVSRQAISKWELDCSKPDIDNIISLGELFNISTDYLLTEQQNDNKKIQENVQNNKSNILKIIESSKLYKSIFILVCIIIIFLLFFYYFFMEEQLLIQYLKSEKYSAKQ